MTSKVYWWSVFSASFSVISAVVCLGLVSRDEKKEHRFAKMWFILNIITASLAATYYSKIVNWQKVAQLRQYHSNFLWLCRVLGVPVMSAHLAESGLALENASQVLAGLGIIVFAVGCWGVRHRQLVTTVANGLVMAVMGVLCCLHRSVSGECWVLLLSSALYIGTHGSPLPVWHWKLPRIDLWHWLIAASNVALYLATPLSL